MTKDEGMNPMLLMMMMNQDKQTGPKKKDNTMMMMMMGFMMLILIGGGIGLAVYLSKKEESTNFPNFPKLDDQETDDQETEEDTSITQKEADELKYKAFEEGKPFSIRKIGSEKCVNAKLLDMEDENANAKERQLKVVSYSEGSDEQVFTYDKPNGFIKIKAKSDYCFDDNAAKDDNLSDGATFYTYPCGETNDNRKMEYIQDKNRFKMTNKNVCLHDNGNGELFPYECIDETPQNQFELVIYEDDGKTPVEYDIKEEFYGLI
jgi:hypothetical protein